VSAPTPAALRTVRALSRLWNIGLQPGSAEDTAARLVDEQRGLPELLKALRQIDRTAEVLRENAQAEGHSWEEDDAEGIRNAVREILAKAER
jgi:hypothetical protein